MKLQVIKTVFLIAFFNLCVAYLFAGYFGEVGRLIIAHFTGLTAIFCITSAIIVLLVVPFPDINIFFKTAWICLITAFTLLDIGYILYYFEHISPFWHAAASMEFDVSAVFFSAAAILLSLGFYNLLGDKCDKIK